MTEITRSGAAIAMLTIVLACNLPFFMKAEKSSDAQLVEIAALVDEPIQAPTRSKPTAKVVATTDESIHATAVPTFSDPTAVEQIVGIPTQKTPAKRNFPALPTVVPGKTLSLFEGNYRGLGFTALYTEKFSHTSSNGWELFCLKSDKSVCVSIYPHNGNWDDAQALANEEMEKVRKKTSNMTIYQEQSITMASDGFPAYWIGSTYTYKGVNYDSSNLFIVVQHIGFNIVADGEAQKFESYRGDLECIMNSVATTYN